MRGILAEQPKLQTITGPDGRQFRVADVKLRFSDERPGVDDGRCRLIAWDAQADALTQYRNGEEIEFIGRLNSNQVGQSADLTFTLLKIDDSKTLVHSTEQFLMDFVSKKERLAVQISRAEQQKAENEAANQDSPQKKTIQ